MSNPYFKFKQFTVYHDRCAMKVGTDGVLLGAWARVEQAKTLLDIGTGAGVIALMAAQRSGAQIVGIEIDAAAAGQAKENVARSPWAQRVEIVCIDLRQMTAAWQFDSIVSNPPYFTNSLKCSAEGRNLARHDETLSLKELMMHAAKLLQPEGEFSVIIPYNELNNLLGYAIGNRLFPSRKCTVQTTPKAAPKRCMVAVRPIPTERVEEERLIIETTPGVFSEKYKMLTKDFYLKM